MLIVFLLETAQPIVYTSIAFTIVNFGFKILQVNSKNLSLHFFWIDFKKNALRLLKV